MGKTILFVSHDLSSIAKYCDRVILLNQGEKISEGSPKEMVDLYKQLLVHQGDVEKVKNDELEEIKTVIRDSSNNDLWKACLNINQAC